jgi:hypothetical protein
MRVSASHHLQGLDLPFNLATRFQFQRLAALDLPPLSGTQDRQFGDSVESLALSLVDDWLPNESEEDARDEYEVRAPWHSGQSTSHQNRDQHLHFVVAQPVCGSWGHSTILKSP